MDELRVIYTRNGVNGNERTQHIEQEMPHEIESVLRSIGDKHFLTVINGDSMKNAGIRSGDTVIVLSTETATDADIVLCSVSGKHLLKRIFYLNGKVELHSENPDFGVMHQKEDDIYICGIATHVIKALK